MNHTLLVLCLMSLNFTVRASDPKIDSLKKLGREVLIDLAVQKINSPDFDPSEYDRITVKANDEQLIVEFELSVKLKGMGRCYYSEVHVALAGSGTGKGIEGECGRPEYLHRTNSEKRKIHFVFTSINRSDKVVDIPNNELPKGTTMTITERFGYYFVETSSRSTYSHFKVNKLTGNISDAQHKHYARSGESKDNFEIIK